MWDGYPLCFFDLYCCFLVEAAVGLIGVVWKDINVAFLVDIDLAGIVLHLHFDLGLHPQSILYLLLLLDSIKLLLDWGRQWSEIGRRFNISKYRRGRKSIMGDRCKGSRGSQETMRF